jgi:hypothetical protein
MGAASILAPSLCMTPQRLDDGRPCNLSQSLSPWCCECSAALSGRHAAALKSASWAERDGQASPAANQGRASTVVTSLGGPACMLERRFETMARVGQCSRSCSCWSKRRRPGGGCSWRRELVVRERRLCVAATTSTRLASACDRGVRHCERHTKAMHHQLERESDRRPGLLDGRQARLAARGARRGANCRLRWLR